MSLNFQSICAGNRCIVWSTYTWKSKAWPEWLGKARKQNMMYVLWSICFSLYRNFSIREFLSLLCLYAIYYSIFSLQITECTPFFMICNMDIVSYSSCYNLSLKCNEWLGSNNFLTLCLLYTMFSDKIESRFKMLLDS